MVRKLHSQLVKTDWHSNLWASPMQEYPWKARKHSLCCGAAFRQQLQQRKMTMLSLLICPWLQKFSLLLGNPLSTLTWGFLHLLQSWKLSSKISKASPHPATMCGGCCQKMQSNHRNERCGIPWRYTEAWVSAPINDQIWWDTVWRDEAGFCSGLGIQLSLRDSHIGHVHMTPCLRELQQQEVQFSSSKAHPSSRPSFVSPRSWGATASMACIETLVQHIRLANWGPPLHFGEKETICAPSQDQTQKETKLLEWL